MIKISDKKIERAKKLLSTIEMMVDNQIDKAKFNKKKKAVVQSINPDKTANVTINGELKENIKIRAGLLPVVGEVVWVEIPNDSLKDAFIDTANATLVESGELGTMFKAQYDTDDDGKVDYANNADSVSWSGIIDKPSTFEPSEHSHETFIYNQISPSSQWSIQHNKNKFPSVTIVDSSDNIVYGDVQYIDKNNIVLKFNGEFSGKAYLN